MSSRAGVFLARPRDDVVVVDVVDLYVRRDEVDEFALATAAAMLPPPPPAPPAPPDEAASRPVSVSTIASSASTVEDLSFKYPGWFCK